MVVDIVRLDEDGYPVGRPANWKGGGTPPDIIISERPAGPRGTSAGGALGIGDRALVRTRMGRGRLEGQVVRKLQPVAEAVLGIYDGANRIHSTQRVGVEDYWVHNADLKGAEKGDLVLVQILARRRLERPRAKVLEVLGNEDGTGAFSLIAIKNHDIPLVFPSEALDEAEAARGVTPDDRVDLREVPLVTIDGEDARDFDDAVWAEVIEDEEGRPGWHLIVAIADVAWYVRPGSALDREALKRGNSTYFPDRVVPMLPEALSNGWCSLKPKEDRACMVAHIWIDASGAMLRHRFERAIMNSAARLTYTQVQAAWDAKDAKLLPILAPLYGAYAALNEARERRDSHKLIEEFMIAANVASAETLEHLKQPTVYRVHDAPPDGKLEEFSEFARGIGFKFDRGQVVKPSLFNGLLKRAEEQGIGDVVSQMVLRTQAQAEYSTVNIGHFGLALRRYCHFTSPIRRYADLLVHRGLITGLKLGAGGFSGSSRPDLAPAAALITSAERRSVAAEREAADRFVASYYATREGDIVEGRIVGSAKSGLFVRIDGSMVDGFVPRRSLPGGGGFSSRMSHGGSRRGAKGRGGKGAKDYETGDRVSCRIVEADGVRGSLILEILDHEPVVRPAKPRR
jgi:ribonuclease R